MPPYVGIEIYFRPTAKARDIWKASMTFVNLIGDCFVLTTNQFYIGREDNLLSLECILYFNRELAKSKKYRHLFMKDGLTHIVSQN